MSGKTKYDIDLSWEIGNRMQNMMNGESRKLLFFMGLVLWWLRGGGGRGGKVIKLSMLRMGKKEIHMKIFLGLTEEKEEEGMVQKE